MESQQEVQTPGAKRSQDKGESGHYQRHRIQTEPARSYSDPFGLIRSTFQDKTGIKREKQDFFQQEAERVRPHDPEDVAIQERSTTEPEIALSTSNRIRSPPHGRITPTKNGHSVVTPESNININEVWLQMSQF
ncbi:hypothetical protein O181_122704 [Austropuccinia psidii MF-1]|uniref:Uncharacterized protein n=1 Tax=Austropuccinia psidii MF-1 TaxID=1389203 RepID=A0A9Q3KL33_9BASI|nr:hypothetical protein [Austropuccinia psidii MF-1]